MRKVEPAYRGSRGRFEVPSGTFAVLSIALTFATASARTSDDEVPLPTDADASRLEFFERRVRPLLIEHCLECHDPAGGGVKGGLNLASASGWARGGDSGPVIVPGDPGKSLLYQAVTYHDQEFAMPPRGRLSDGDIETLRLWIEAGAVDPRVDPGAENGEDAPDPWLDPNGLGRTHWAYQPVQDVEPPRLPGDDWSRTPIDRFIYRSLREADLAPVAAAEPRVLARRAYFDLIGLPPSPEEMRSFLEEHDVDAEAAWRRLVDRLLESPHYGERWGRHWLDVARYADSNGLDENTAFGNAWRYRDWVVRAFNQDLPYDEFVTRQIAGDLLPEPGDRDEAVDNLLATGFLSLGPKVLAEPDKEKMLVDLVDEQLDVLGKAFLAQTIGCARCHDHKFDPITHADYYAMAGIFVSTRTMETLNTVAKVLERDLAPRSEIEAMRRHVDSVERNRDEMVEAEREAAAALASAWAGRTSDALMAAATLTLAPTIREAEDAPSTNLRVDYDQWGDGVGVLHTHRPNETQFVEYALPDLEGGRWRVRVRYASGEARPVRIVAGGRNLASEFCGESTGGFGIENLRWSTIDLDIPAGAGRIRFERDGAFPHFERISLAKADQVAAHDREIERVAAARSIDPSLLRRWSEALSGDSLFVAWRAYSAIDPGAWSELAPAVTADLQSRFEIEAVEADGTPGRSGATPSEVPFLRAIVAGPVPESLGEIASRWQGVTSLVVDAWLRRTNPDEEPADAPLPDPVQDVYRRALVGEQGVLRLGEDVEGHVPAATRRRIADLRAAREELDRERPEPFSRGIAVEDGDPRDLPIFIRGDHMNKREEAVPRGYLTVLAEAVDAPPIGEGVSGRLELAEWITDPGHPLTARTMVNRLWAWHFGRGIVATPSNFGLRGAPPTHPELLDWLARIFVESGWSIKSMHRLIMNSSVYRLSGVSDPAAVEVDPANTLWWRRVPTRLEAEPIRDALLAVGGQLDRTIGGSLLRSDNFGYVTNDQSASNERYDVTRRAVYLPVIRNDMYSMFSTFDYTDPSISIETRPATVVPQQSLFMMNSPIVAAQAQALADRILRDESLDDAARINRAYEICFGREAEPAEIDRALRFVGQLEATVGPGRSAAWPSSESMGESVEEISPERHAWRSLCKVLLASNEFIYIR